MRTIKFRVWDKDQKKYRSEKDGDYSLGVLSGEVRGIYGEKFPQMKVEQFIELHDKNGKEIYEGDILKHDLDGIFTITYSVYFVGFVAESQGSLTQEPFTPNYLNRCEIIGNVFENAALVKL